MPEKYNILNDRYRLDEELGRGGMGVVYKAFDQLLGRVVAIKLLTSEEIGTEGRNNLLSEARAVAKLNHPNIVSVYDAGGAGKFPYIVMEYIEGESLHDKQPTEIEEILQFAEMICDALAEAHSHGLIHRDLKPENIIQMPDGGLKLTDFGLALSVSSQSRDYDALEGTVVYLSPEQAMGREIDERSDLYALGVILYEFLTGELPFSGEDPLAVISSHISRDPVPPRELNAAITPRLESVVLQLLNKNPDDRFQSARDLQIILKAINPDKETRRDPRPNHNIPEDISSFIGRRTEIATVIDLFPSARLITLTGVGGTGKSRLAYQIARRKVQDFKDGVRLFELASLSDSSMVNKTIANVLQIRERKDMDILSIITEFLIDKEILLVFDNCEHLIRDCGLTISKILSTCPEIKVLITSRESLGIHGEITYIVPSMEIPGVDDSNAVDDPWLIESMHLFLDRAREVHPEFSPNVIETQAVVEICRRLDGMPLAIELAAARVRIMSVEQIAMRLSESFRLLTGGSRAALPRQQTLRTLIDWSYDLLSEDEKELFERLSVFSNGWTITAAEEVCADENLPKIAILDLLARLVDKSIISAERMTGEARYRMLETIRQYALEKLIRSREIQKFRAKHLIYFRNLIEETSPKLRQSEQVRWLDVLELDHDNIRAALDWGISGYGSAKSISFAAEIATSFLQFWMVRGFWVEAWTWVKKIRENPEFFTLEMSMQAKVLNTAGKIISDMGDIRKAEDLFHQALLRAREINDCKAEAYALLGLSGIALNEHFIERAEKYIRRSHKLFQSESDVFGQAIALSIKGSIAAENGMNDQATAYFNENITLNRKAGNRLGVAGTLLALGNIEIIRGEIGKGRQYLIESLNIFRNSKDKSGEAGTLSAIGLADLYASQMESSHIHYQQALRINRELHRYPGMGTALIALGEIARSEGDFIAAQKYYVEAAQINENLGQVGIVMIVAHNLGYVETRLGNYHQALDHFRRALKLSLERDRRRFVYFCTIGIASVYVEMERYEDGARLFSSSRILAQKEKYNLDPVDQFAVDASKMKLKANIDSERLNVIELEAKTTTPDEVINLARGG